MDKSALIGQLSDYKKTPVQNKVTSLVIIPESKPVVTSQTKIVNPEKVSIIVDGKSYGNMIYVPGGTFLMGAQKKDKTAANYDPDAYEESPVHRVTLDDFYIGETQVTQGFWKAVMKENPSYFPKGDDFPVESVSWDYIVNIFLPELNRKTGKNFRLPTEAEWEYAARGGNKSKGYKYSGSNNIKDVAVYDEVSYDLGKKDSNYGTHAVKSLSSNELGIYDMSGNVWEWCQDKFANGVVTNQTGSSWRSSRVLRGGSWYNSAGGCRVSLRSDSDPCSRGDLYGLRLALSVPQ